MLPTASIESLADPHAGPGISWLRDFLSTKSTSVSAAQTPDDFSASELFFLRSGRYCRVGGRGARRSASLPLGPGRFPGGSTKLPI